MACNNKILAVEKYTYKNGFDAFGLCTLGCGRDLLYDATKLWVLSARISKNVFGYIKYVFGLEEKMKRRFLILTAFSVAVTLQLQGLYAFDNKKTHPVITEKDAVGPMTDNYLTTQLESRR
jgi:hypothetical protein